MDCVKNHNGTSDARAPRSVVRCAGGWPIQALCWLEWGSFKPSLGSKSQRLQDVLSLKVGIVGEKFINRATGADLAENHADRHSHAADACLATHHARLLGNTVQSFHLFPPSRITMIATRNLSSNIFAGCPTFAPCFSALRWEAMPLTPCPASSFPR